MRHAAFLLPLFILLAGCDEDRDRESARSDSRRAERVKRSSGEKSKESKSSKPRRVRRESSSSRTDDSYLSPEARNPFVTGPFGDQ
ncbi:MAG TPA: hypothetical protein VEK08_14165 [Planctomycetota bacterium]|nr:hypothetical protein [Planctomycetota bacterium]